MSILLIGKKLNIEKEKFFILQNGKCALCGRDLDTDIQSNHLDHDHALLGKNAGKVRSLLCCYCNALEGQIKHKFESSGLKSRNVDASQWLRNLADYIEKDYSENNYHPKFVGDLSKYFSRLNLSEMDDLAKNYDLIFEPKTTKEKRVPIFKKALKLFLKGV